MDTNMGVGATNMCCLFFQAEDGIRYLTVTGVQTCALPISMALIRILGATALALALLPAPLSAQISDNVVKIGVLTDLNGPASTPTGQGSVTAAQINRKRGV